MQCPPPSSPSNAGLGIVPPPQLLLGVPMIGTSTVDSTATPPMTTPAIIPNSLPEPLPTWNMPPTLSLPPKMIKKILNLEFVDMSELLQDSWRPQEEEHKCCHQRRGQRRGPITDILVWVECYGTLQKKLCTMLVTVHETLVTRLTTKEIYELEEPTTGS